MIFIWATFVALVICAIYAFVTTAIIIRKKDLRDDLQQSSESLKKTKYPTFKK